MLVFGLAVLGEAAYKVFLNLRQGWSFSIRGQIHRGHPGGRRHAGEPNRTQD